MAYNVIDIIDKAIYIEERTKKIIVEAGKDKENDIRIKVMSKVIIEQLNKSIKKYCEIKEQYKNEELEEIDFMSYDKISFLINEFNSKVYFPDIKNPIEYLQFALDLSKERYSLFIDLQGRLANNIGNVENQTYDILSMIINRIKEEISSIENAIKRH